MADSTASETRSQVVSLARNPLVSFLRNQVVSLARNQVVNFTGISKQTTDNRQQKVNETICPFVDGRE